MSSRRRKINTKEEKKDLENVNEEIVTVDQEEEGEPDRSEIEEEPIKEESKPIVEIKEKKIEPIKEESKPVVEIKKMPVFTNPVEIFEEKTLRIRAKNKTDAEKALKLFLQSQDEVINIHSASRGYDAKVLIFKLREL